ncbi:MAG: YdeI/OmpD-associated family protein [Sphingomonas taxi]
MTQPPATRFSWTVPAGEAAGHIPLPFDPRAVFGRARPAVVVSLRGYSYRSTVAIMGGETFVPFRRSHRDTAGVVAGDVVEVTLTLDTAPRTVAVPDDLNAALAEAGVAEPWAQLSYTHQREVVDGLTAAKRPDTGGWLRRWRCYDLDFCRGAAHIGGHRGVMQRERVGR